MLFFELLEFKFCAIEDPIGKLSDPITKVEVGRIFPNFYFHGQVAMSKNEVVIVF